MKSLETLWPGSLHADVQRQAWKCERCGSEGTVEIKPDSGCYEVLMAIQSAHAAKAPTCSDHSKIRVPLNAELSQSE